MPDPLKIVCYNILEGGMGRLDPIYETLLHLDADVVGLCEADDPKGVRYLAEKLGLEHVSAEATGGRAVAMLSRRPIGQMVNLSITHPVLDRGAMETVVTWDGKPLRIVLLHLASGQDPEDEQRRLEQLAAALSCMGEEIIPTVVMGDLNTGAAYHPFDLAAASPKVRQRLAVRGKQSLDHDVVTQLIGAGWVDAHHVKQRDHPKHTYTTGFPCSRFDYIFLSNDVAGRLIDADVEQGGFAPYCSDHYPLWAKLQ